MPRPARRALAILLGSLAALALLEAGLRVGSWLLATSRPAGRKATADLAIPRVLFAGDSHTFGLWVEDDEAMPAVAEALAAEHAPPGIVSVNRGRAGAPSWVALEELRAGIVPHRPVAMVLRAGVNDGWVAPPEDAAWWDSLRIARLARVVLAGRETSSGREVGHAREDLSGDARPAAEFSLAGRDGAALSPRDRTRLEGIVAEAAGLAARAGARLFVMTYLDPGPRFAEVNALLRDAARARGARLVDVAPFAEACLRIGTRQEILFPDGHPRRLGYGIEARALLAALAEEGAIRCASPPDPVAWYRSARDQPALPPPGFETALHVVAEPDGSRVCEVATAPGADVRLLLGRLGPRWILGNASVPLRAEDVEESGAWKEARGRADASGHTTLRLPASLLRLLPTGLYVAAVAVDSARARLRFSFSLLRDVETGEASPEAIRTGLAESEIDVPWDPGRPFDPTPQTPGR